MYVMKQAPLDNENTIPSPGETDERLREKKGRQEPVISVIIPTRERAETLKYAIATALDQDSDAIEVIVCDNCSKDNTREVFESFSDNRLRYVNPGRRLSMCDNWDFALEHATGRYVVFIGDDDAALPGALDKLQKVIETNTYLVYTWATGIYIWPFGESAARVETIPTDTAPFEMDLRDLVHQTIRTGLRDILGPPGVYHSAVAKQILDEIRESTGRVFHSTQPDIFTGFAVPAFTSKALNLGFSATAHGKSAKANSASTVNKNGEVSKDAMGNLQQFIKEYGDYQVHPTLFPGFSNRINLFPDSLLVAMDLFPQLYGNVKYNYEGMWVGLCLLKQLDLSKWEIIRQARHIRQYHSFSMLRFLWYLIRYGIMPRVRNAFRRSTQTSLGPFKHKVPDNIYDFVKQLVEWKAGQGTP